MITISLSRVVPSLAEIPWLMKKCILWNQAPDPGDKNIYVPGTMFPTTSAATAITMTESNKKKSRETLFSSIEGLPPPETINGRKNEEQKNGEGGKRSPVGAGRNQG